jgi:hypothetical protein
LIVVVKRACNPLDETLNDTGNDIPNYGCHGFLS